MNAYAALLLGVLAAGVGGELFVRGVVGIAGALRVSSGIVGATLAAFATSSPELSVAIGSATAGSPAISLGDALGSNVVNIALVLALALTLSGMGVPRDSVRRDLSVALLVPLGLALLLLDGRVSRLEGWLLLGLFALWLSAAVADAARERSAATADLGERRPWAALAFAGLGLAFLVVAGKLVVTGARGIAEAFGIGEFVIGATLVAVGTSIPELATTLVAKVRGHDEVGLGTVLGSNIFNGLFIVGVAASIHPIEVPWSSVGAALGFGLLTTLLVFPGRSGWIGRQRGVLLLAVYGSYVTLVLLSGE
jgi:cation:H+ antiporter